MVNQKVPYSKEKRLCMPEAYFISYVLRFLFRKVLPTNISTEYNFETKHFLGLRNFCQNLLQHHSNLGQKNCLGHAHPFKMNLFCKPRPARSDLMTLLIFMLSSRALKSPAAFCYWPRNPITVVHRRRIPIT